MIAGHMNYRFIFISFLLKKNFTQNFDHVFLFFSSSQITPLPYPLNFRLLFSQKSSNNNKISPWKLEIKISERLIRQKKKCPNQVKWDKGSTEIPLSFVLVDNFQVGSLPWNEVNISSQWDSIRETDFTIASISSRYKTDVALLCQEFH